MFSGLKLMHRWIFNLLLQLDTTGRTKTHRSKKETGRNDWIVFGSLSSHQLGWRPFKMRTKWNLTIFTCSKPLTYNYLSVWLCVVVGMVAVLYTWSGSELLSCLMRRLQPEGKHLARRHRKPDQQTISASTTAVMFICTTVMEMVVQISSARLSHM